MQRPDDLDYFETRLIKQGIAKMTPIFQDLADWINQCYRAKPLNIFYEKDSMNNNPRLSIIFEFEKNELKFRDGFLGNFHEEKQEKIAEQFKQVITRHRKKLKPFSAFFTLPLKYRTKNLFVVFTSFERYAKSEVIEKIPEHEIQQLKQKINTPGLWTIYRQFASTTFFFYTDQQITELDSTGAKELLAAQYLELVKKYDDFGYFTRENLVLNFDSKENFDTNYKGSWFYYSR